LGQLDRPSGDRRAAAERRIRLNPSDPDGWYLLSILHRYDLPGSSPAEARRCLSRALGLHPWSYRYWFEMSQIMAGVNDLPAASASLRLALSLNRSYTPLYWYAGNYFIRTGDPASAARCFRRALTGDPSLIRPVLAICWRLYPDRGALIRDIVPPVAGLQFGLLNWCIQQNDPVTAGLCWQGILNLPEAFEPSAAFPYINYLIQQGEYSSAHGVWRQSLARFGEESARPADDRMYNGDFERTRWNGGFDWVAHGTAHTRFVDSRRGRFRGVHSLMIDFDGSENVAGPVLSQYVYVERPGNYRFRYAIRTDPLPSDQGVYFEIVAMPPRPGSEPLARGEKHLAEESWRLCNMFLEVPTAGTLLQVRLRRDRSVKFDNLLRGRVWLDAVELVAEAGP
jgi:hypothetical protein